MPTRPFHPTKPLKSPPTTSPPPDGEPVGVLAKALGVTAPTIRGWCRWKSHPVLGRRLRSGLGDVEDDRWLWRGLLVSRADLEACVAAIKDPCHRRFPRNVGVWIAPGIFKHDDGRLFFTERYIYASRSKFRMPECTLSRPFYRMRLEALQVVWPRREKRGGGWTANVYSEASLDSLVERRNGLADGGRWLVSDEIWSDRDGVWYSLKYIARQTGQPVTALYTLLRSIREQGVVTRSKKAPRSNNRGSLPVVHHESNNWVRTLLPILGPPTNDGHTSALPAPSVVAAAARGKAREAASDAPAALQPRIRNKGGRPRSDRTRAIYERCWQLYLNEGKKATVVMEIVNREFQPKKPDGPKAIRYVTHVASFAKRYLA